MTGRSLLAAVAAAGTFALLHMPNPFLTLYTLGGGLILTVLYLRLPNLLAATLAHALASALAKEVLPSVVTGGMKVGPNYW
jgi:membrane protease YdiL (CAAX protease family)